DGPGLLLVWRRDDTGAMSWQFPSGIVKPGTEASAAAVRETLEETGVRCAVRAQLGSRLHPITRAYCEYFLCDYIDGTAENRDAVENIAATWVERGRLTDLIPADRLFPPILAVCQLDRRTEAR